MKRIFYLTRSYLPDKSGGILMRVGTVRLLMRKGFDVQVITVDKKRRQVYTQENLHYIPFFPFSFRLTLVQYFMKISYILERLGIFEDYLDPWVWNAQKYLLPLVTKNDIMFATSGGELGTIKLGCLIKQRIGCSFIVNFRDPLDYSIIKGVRIDNRFHVKREKAESKYLNNANAIITSSEFYAQVLRNKYPQLKDKIFNNYFGYIDEADITPGKAPINKIKVAYGGVYGSTQSPEILAEAAYLLDCVELYFIGNSSSYKPLAKYSKNPAIHFIPFLERDRYLKFMNNMDVGFLSLKGEYFGACVPSKLYEYLNLGLPILGALPPGDAMDIINYKGYGIACRYDDIKKLRQSLTIFLDPNRYNKFRENILNDREKWSMENKINEVIHIINSVCS